MTATTAAKRHTVAPKTVPAAVLDLGADLSPAVKALEDAYRIIRRTYPDAPEVTIVVKRDARAWGHTTVDPQWSTRESEAATHYEVMISGENLRRGPEAVAATLLHEAAHAMNLARGWPHRRWPWSPPRPRSSR